MLLKGIHPCRCAMQGAWWDAGPTAGADPFACPVVPGLTNGRPRPGGPPAGRHLTRVCLPTNRPGMLDKAN